MIDASYSSEQEDTVVTFRKTPKKKSNVLSSSDEEELNLSAVLHSTPISHECQEFEIFKRKIDETLSSYKSKLKQNRDEEKANNEEFVRVLSAVLNGETPEVENSVSHPEVIWNGKNLMGLYAGPEPSKFGRKLAVEMFGEKETSLLKTKSLVLSKADAKQELLCQRKLATLLKVFFNLLIITPFVFLSHVFFSDIWATPEEGLNITLTLITIYNNYFLCNFEFVVLNFS